MVSVRVHRLLKIIVPVPLDDASFEKTARQWDRDLAHSALPPSMTPDEVETMVIFLLGKIPHPLAFDILEDLVKEPALRRNLLEQVFDRGNDRCRVSMCERSDLPQRLEDKCRNSSMDVDAVRENYRASIRDRSVTDDRDDEFLEILIPNPLDDSSFEEASKLWDQGRDAFLTVPRSMSPHQIETMVIFLLGKIPAELAFSVLSYLAEDSPLRGDLLEQIFDRGDTGCKVSVCLRPDLDKRLEEKCRNSPNDDVREHYQARI